ncbi:MAG: ZIP family metal transporter [Proteobacteria bacterium]|nr:ZIP family metal transporter [Pseudomonadota bacterium]
MITLKLFAAVLVLMAGIGGGLLATRITKRKGQEKIAGLANTFAGGVFLGAAFLHMLPDAIENFNTFMADSDYPVFALVAALGFLIVMLLDKVLAPAYGGADSPKVIYPYVLMATLSVHSLITGMALGLETHLVSAGAILFAVLAHKSTAAMALSISFAKGGAPAARSRNLLGIFYTTTPLGILVGTWLATAIQGPGEVHFEAIFDALAAGTFFYIAVMDILAEEFKGKHNHLQNFAMVTLGFSVMAVVAIWT